MTLATRRSIAEIAALYELEPSLRDIMVEGRDDRALIKWFLRTQTKCEFGIYEIDSVEIPSSLLDHYELPDGNVGRVKVLAYELDVTLKGAARECIKLVVDADGDYVTKKSRPVPMLLNTDYANMEMYLFSEVAIEKLTSVVLIGCALTTQVVISHLALILQRLFLIRLANVELKWGLSWITFERCCTISNAEIEFDEDEFVRRYLLAGGKFHERDLFIAKIASLESALTEDPRRQMHGHDYFEVIRWYLRSHVEDRKPLTDARSFERAFFACVSSEELGSEPLFQSLIEHVTH